MNDMVAEARDIRKLLPDMPTEMRDIRKLVRDMEKLSCDMLKEERDMEKLAGFRGEEEGFVRVWGIGMPRAMPPVGVCCPVGAVCW